MYPAAALVPRSGCIEKQVSAIPQGRGANNESRAQQVSFCGTRLGSTVPRR